MKNTVTKFTYENFRDLVGELSMEVNFLSKRLVDTDKKLNEYPDPSTLSKVERRLIVRSIFSFVEGIIFQLKTIGLGLNSSNKLSVGEIVLAREESFELDDSGKVQIRKAKLSFLKNFRFAFTLFAKAAEIDYEINVNGSEWQALNRSVRVRDRLMHPKHADDLTVTDDDIRDVFMVFEWILEESARLAAKSLLRLRKTSS